MRDVSTLPATIVCLLIAATVMVSGTHAKDIALASLPAVIANDTKKTDDTSQHTYKIATELHHHSDNSAKIQSAHDGQQADHRSLRIHDHKKRHRLL